MTDTNNAHQALLNLKYLASYLESGDRIYIGLVADQGDTLSIETTIDTVYYKSMQAVCNYLNIKQYSLIIETTTGNTLTIFQKASREREEEYNPQLLLETVTYCKTSYDVVRIEKVEA